MLIVSNHPKAVLCKFSKPAEGVRQTFYINFLKKNSWKVFYKATNIDTVTKSKKNTLLADSLPHKLPKLLKILTIDISFLNLVGIRG